MSVVLGALPQALARQSGSQSQDGISQHSQLLQPQLPLRNLAGSGRHTVAQLTAQRRRPGAAAQRRQVAVHCSLASLSEASACPGHWQERLGDLGFNLGFGRRFTKGKTIGSGEGLTPGLLVLPASFTRFAGGSATLSHAR